MTDASAATADKAPGDFIRRWEASGAAERANYALFLAELCDLLHVPRPEPTRPDDAENAYVFERSVTFQNGDGTTSVGRIDLYKRGCFVLEAKQGSEKTEADASGLVLPKRPKRKGTAVRGTSGWDDAMLAARGQAEQYVRALPATEPNPPFLIVVDVGHTLELFTDFTRQGRTYTPFPDALTHRLKLAQLADPEIQERLRLAWTDPLSLDPSRRSAKVTREVAARLAILAKSLEASGHSPEAGAQFLMRCLFTFFAEDVGLLPAEGFTALLRSLRDNKEAAKFPDMVGSLWETMKAGGFSPILRAHLLRFNGGLFESADALPVTADQLELLVQAGEKQWRDVEPAIFGTLLERALNPIERHKLGAHYTPRAYVERLVMPTIIEPLRDEWSIAQTAAVTLANDGKLPEAREEVRAFLKKLCDTTVLDPACGTGNFLYVTLEHMKRLEGEVRDALKGFGESQAAFEGFGLTVDPHQLRGIEINPRAAAIADLVLWIGYLQWHFRTFGNTMPAEPIIHAYHNIECRDAVLAYDGTEPLRDERGTPVTRWDGRTMKMHAVTGEDVPDETARVFVLKYLNPRKAEWPDSDYVIGNPPFIGDKTMKEALGPGYVKALRSTYNDIGDASDYVMYWWDHAAGSASLRRIRRFGLVATNSIWQTYNRRVIQKYLENTAPISILYAIPDHPWIDDEKAAAVRISMTVAEAGDREGERHTVLKEGDTSDGLPKIDYARQVGKIYADLTISANVAAAKSLRSNEKVCCPGVKLFGEGFVITESEAANLGCGRPLALELPIKPYRIARDLTQRPSGRFVIDTFGLKEDELRDDFPKIYQWLRERVKPERDNNNRPSYRNKWWLFGEPRAVFRKSLVGLSRYIVTPETSKYKFFSFLDSSILAEGSLVVFSFANSYELGVLSSKIHVAWALAAGGRLGVGNDPRYNKTRCFDPFAFPECSEVIKDKIRDQAEKLDTFRKGRQAEHPDLTMTGMYNVLAKLRSGDPLTDKEKTIHEQGLVSVLKQIHDDLDAAVFDAYGWPQSLTDEEILQRLVELNKERAAEEARGIIRWLRPEFQNPEGAGAKPTQTTLLPDEPEPVAAEPAAPSKKQPWPKSLAEQAQAVRDVLGNHPAGLTPESLARLFVRARADRVSDLLDTLVSLGQARAVENGRYVRS